MGKYRAFAIAAASFVVAAALVAQIGRPEAPERRYIQHERMPSAPADADGLGCIRGTIGVSHDPGAVDAESLATHLPLLEIDTGGRTVPGAPYYAPGEDETRYTVAPDGQTTIGASLFVRSGGTVHTLADAPDMVSNIKMRVRGNSSRWFDKKSYAIRTMKKDGVTDDAVALLGMEKHDDWVLHGPFLDKSLLRNYLGMNISGQMMDTAPNVRFCELVLDGEYLGLYLLMETVSRGKERVEVRKPTKEKNITGYIVQFDSNPERSPKALEHFTGYTGALKSGAQLLVEYPGPRTLTPELRDFIERDISKAERALYSYDYDSKQFGYYNDFDLEEFADYFILMEIFEMHDTGNLSTYYYRDVPGPIRPCVWDFNNCSGNYSIDIKDDYTIRKFVTVQAPWFWMMCKDEVFIEAVIDRYRELRGWILGDDYLNRFIDEAVSYLGPAVDRNFAVWGYSFDPKNLDVLNKLHPDERNVHSYEEAVGQLKGTLLARLHWMDEHIGILRQYSHESAVKKFNP